MLLNRVLESDQLSPELSEILPPEYTYIIKHLEYITSDSENTDLAFTCSILVNAKSAETASKWIEDFQKHCDVEYRVTCGKQPKGKKVIYKSIQHCQHKRKSSKPPKSEKRIQSFTRRDKKTDCKSTLNVKVHNQRQSLSKNLQTHPCEIHIVWNHNHTISSAHAHSFKRISPETKEKFTQYFEQGHSPATAREIHQLNIEMEFHGDEYYLEILKSNRSLNPWSRDIYYLHRKWRETNLGKGNGGEMFKKLEQIIHDYNTNNNQQGGRAYLQRFERKHGQSTRENTCPDDYEQHLVLAICTPLMARTHQLIQQTSELVHCDSTASLDRYNSPTFILSTATAAGGIPLGVVITSGESEDVITEALTSLKAILPEKAFYGRGSAGPELVITDDSAAEQAAIHSTWNGVTIFLCVFHYLQSWWTWLWEAKQGISKDDRMEIMQLVKQLVYKKTQTEMESQYFKLTTTSVGDILQKYPHAIARLEDFWKRRHQWALAYRMDKVMRGNQTNNIAEAGMRIIKDLVFGRVKAYNLIQMFDFITTVMERYFQNRLLDIAHSRYRAGIELKFRNVHKLSLDIPASDIQKTSNSTYTVLETIKGIQIDFDVDMDLGRCSCFTGYTGQPCKHQAVVAKVYNIATWSMPPFFSKETRQTFALIATGIHQSLDFYADLRDTKTCQNPTDTSGTTQDEGTEVMDLDGSNENYTDGSNEDYTHGSNEGYYCNSDHESTGSNENTEILAGYRASLSSITEDMLMRIETGDHSIISAVSKFIQRYSRLKDSHAPSPAMADALHMFGKTSSKFICIPLCVVLVRFHLIIVLVKNKSLFLVLVSQVNEKRLLKH